MEYWRMHIPGFGTAEFYYNDFQYWVNQSFDNQVKALTEIREGIERINAEWSRVEWCAILADGRREITNNYNGPF